MKTLLILFLIWATQINTVDSITDEAQKYIFIKKQDEISLSYRWIKVNETNKVRELRAEFEVKSTPEKIVSVLRNEKIALQWMKGVNEVKNLGNPNRNQWHLYIQYGIPWPLNNQDCIIHYKVEIADTNYQIQMNGVPDFIPEKEDVTRIKHLRGTWQIIPMDKHSSRIIYTIYSNQAPRFPRWITDPIVQGNLISSLDAFRTTVQKQPQL